MDKPTVFLSHSAKDSEPIRRLKELLDEKTGGAIEWWLSSDGQSLPLGRNWIAEVHQALERTSLLFCFLTPASFHSAWVHFEAGFAFRGKVDVVPVGLLGVDIASAPGAMPFLQGFNVKNHHSLNNLIQKVNDTFETKYKLSFTAEEFDEIFAATETKAHVEEYLDSLFQTAELTVSYSQNDPTIFINAVTKSDLSIKLLNETKQGKLVFVGCGVSGTWIASAEEAKLHCKIEPGMLPDYLPILHAVAGPLGLKSYSALSLRFKSSVQVIRETSQILRRVRGSEVGWNGNTYTFRNLGFQFIARTMRRNPHSFEMDDSFEVFYLQISLPPDLCSVPFGDLISILEQAKIIDSDPEVPF